MIPKIKNNIENVKMIYGLNDHEVEDLLLQAHQLKTENPIGHNHHFLLRKILKKNLSKNELQESIFSHFKHEKLNLPWSQQEKEVFWANWGGIKPYNLALFFESFPTLIQEITPVRMLAHPKVIQEWLTINELTNAMCIKPTPFVNLTYHGYYGINAPFLAILNNNISITRDNPKIKWDYFKDFIPYVDKNVEVSLSSSKNIKLKAIDVALVFYLHFSSMYLRSLPLTKKEFIQIINQLKPKIMETGALETFFNYGYSTQSVKNFKEALALINYRKDINKFDIISATKSSLESNYSQDYSHHIEVFEALKKLNFDFRKENFLKENILSLYIKKFSNCSGVFKQTATELKTIKDLIAWILENTNINLCQKNNYTKNNIWETLGNLPTKEFKELYDIFKKHQENKNILLNGCFSFIFKIYQEKKEDINFWKTSSEEKWFSCIERNIEKELKKTNFSIQQLEILKKMKIELEEYKLKKQFSNEDVQKIKIL